MKFPSQVSVLFRQVKQFSSLASKESEVVFQSCGKFYEANNNRWPYRRATADGISVRLKFLDTHPSSSSNMPTVLAVHGSPGSYSDFIDLIERLNANGCRVIAPNFPDMSLTDANHKYYHSTEEKYEVLTDFLVEIGAPSFDLAVIHSSGVFPTMKLWNDEPASIRSLMMINPSGYRRIKAMKPAWFIDQFALVNMSPMGRWFFKNYGYKISNAAGVKVKSNKENADAAALAVVTMYQAKVERLAKYAQALKARETPTSIIFSDRDKLIDLEIFHEYIAMLGGSRANINTVMNGELIREAEKELDWLRVFNMAGGGHFAYKKNTALLDKEATRLIETVYSTNRNQLRKTDSNRQLQSNQQRIRHLGTSVAQTEGLQLI